MERTKRAHNSSTPSLEQASPKIFLQNASQRPVSYLILVKGIRLNNAGINPEKTVDLSCRGLLLLIEKSPLTEKHLKQQILNPNQSWPTASEVLRSAICHPNVWYHIC
jgi:hypothetical protein